MTAVLKICLDYRRWSRQFEAQQRAHDREVKRAEASSRYVFLETIARMLVAESPKVYEQFLRARRRAHIDVVR